MQRGWNRHAKFVLLSQLDALEHVVGCKILPGDKICILPVCCRDPSVKDELSFETYFYGNGSKGECYKDILVKNGASAELISFFNYFNEKLLEHPDELLTYDILLLSGGRMEFGIAHLINSKLLECLFRFEGTIICFSAGGMILFDEYLITPNKVYHELTVKPGLGLLDSSSFLIDVHFDQNNLLQRQSIESICNSEKKNVYAITQEGYMVIKDNQVLEINGVFKFSSSHQN